MLCVASGCVAWAFRAPIAVVRGAPGARRVALRGSGDDEFSEPERRRIMDEAKRILDRAQEAPGVDTGKQANSMLTGAFLGGFFGGPLGMMVGASLGGNLGGTMAERREAKRRLAEVGVDEDVVDQIAAAAKDLDEASQSRTYVDSALSSAASFAATLERDRDAAQKAAEGAVSSGDDDAARTYIKARLALDERVTVAKAEAADAQRRLSNLDADVAILRQRCDDLDFLLARRVVATARGERTPFDVDGASSRADDALLARFKNLEARDD